MIRSIDFSHLFLGLVGVDRGEGVSGVRGNGLGRESGGVVIVSEGGEVGEVWSDGVKWTDFLRRTLGGVDVFPSHVSFIVYLH